MPPRLLIAIDYSMRHSVTQIDYSSASPRLLASSRVGRSRTATTEQAAGKPVGIWAQPKLVSSMVISYLKRVKHKLNDDDMEHNGTLRGCG
ncbi:hypothetical protein E3N88_28680 [Mikania micrantha]|uniref:Uncharacterized protein n=1 Tax=Mikania micrantha TaxID=192012 RepID=A0A5N6N066_9ASTR|nr:hypothetical protein E3N88_28680 [Mikania micrantha]